MRRLFSIVSFLILAVAGNTAVAATYVYTPASTYTSASGVYTTSMTVTGSFTTASPLPANLTNANIGPSGSNLVTAWSFNDGVNTLTNLNSMPAAGNPADFNVTTNAAGQITAFLIIVENPLPPNTVGQAMSVIVVTNTMPFQQGVTGAPCDSVNSNSACNSITTYPNSGYSATAAGTFALVSSVSAPMLTPALLALLALALLGFAYTRHARQHRA